MKYFFTLLFSFLVLIALGQQIPDKFYYQGVLLDANGSPVASQTIGVRITILQGSQSGTNVYQETHQVTTDANGRFSLFIGGGTSSGSLSDIDWSAGPYFCNVAIDPSGGTSYSDYGTFQLVSVPYAYLADKAVNVINDSVADADADPTNELQNLSEVLSRGNNAGNTTITGLPTPTNNTDAATKYYVDDQTSKTFTVDRYYVDVILSLSHGFDITTNSSAQDTIKFDYVISDPNSVYDETKGIYYVPTYGYYLVSVSLDITSSTTTSNPVNVYVKANGGVKAAYKFYVANTGGSYHTITFSVPLLLHANQALIITIYDDETSNPRHLRDARLRVIRF